MGFNSKALLVGGIWAITFFSTFFWAEWMCSTTHANTPHALRRYFIGLAPMVALVIFRRVRKQKAAAKDIRR